MPKQLSAREQLAVLQNASQETIQALKTIQDNIKSFKTSPTSALEEFKAQASKLEKEIEKCAKVGNIEEIQLPRKLISTDTRYTPIIVSVEIYNSFEEVSDLYRKYSDLCNIYDKKDGNKITELSTEIQKSRKRIATGLAVLDHIRAHDSRHETDWVKNVSGKVSGNQEVGTALRSLAFDIEPEFTVDYIDQLLELINVIIKKYEIAIELCQMKLPPNKERGANKLSADDKVLAERLAKIKGFLEDLAHDHILRSILSLNMTHFYRHAVESLAVLPTVTTKRALNIFTRFNPLVKNLRNYYDFEKMQTREITEVAALFSQTIIIKNSPELFAQVAKQKTQYEKRAEELKGKIRSVEALYHKYVTTLAAFLFEQNDGKINEKIADKIFFLETCLSIYRKVLQKHNIASAICSALVGTTEPIGQEWVDLEECMQEEATQSKIMGYLDLAVDAVLKQEMTHSLELPAELGNINASLWNFGSLSLFIRLQGIPIRKLKDQAYRLRVQNTQLNTPASSRPVSVMPTPISTSPSSRPVSFMVDPRELRNSIIIDAEETKRQSALLSPGSPNTPQGPEVVTESVASSSAQSNASSSAQSKPAQRPLSSVEELVVKVNKGNFRHFNTVVSKSSAGRAALREDIFATPAPAPTPTLMKRPPELLPKPSQPLVESTPTEATFAELANQIQNNLKLSRSPSMLGTAPGAASLRPGSQVK